MSTAELADQAAKLQLTAGENIKKRYVVGAVGAGMPKQLREARRLIVEKAEFPG
ncbi:hypothetical protein [Nonomuraea sp. NPDC050202]|uniref:hypothetical protein n=1 Tax=Nonomuraea sp. NPDC050202 TaxID=3155035 RepID=UPI0033F29121